MKRQTILTVLVVLLAIGMLVTLAGPVAATRHSIDGFTVATAMLSSITLEPVESTLVESLNSFFRGF